MDYDRVRAFLQQHNLDLLHGNKNYNSQSYLYYFMEDHIQYEALVRFENTMIRAIVLPLLDQTLRTTLFRFHLHLKLYPQYIVCHVKSFRQGLFDATLVIKNRPHEAEPFLVLVQEMTFIYQDRTPKMLVDTLTHLIKTMIRADIQHFLKEVDVLSSRSPLSSLAVPTAAAVPGSVPESASCPVDNKTHTFHTQS
jgi:hypothetical protein